MVELLLQTVMEMTFAVFFLVSNRSVKDNEMSLSKFVPRPQPTDIPVAAWNDAPLYCLSLNTEWVSHVLGVMVALDQPDTWNGTDDEIYAARQAVNEMMLALMTECEEITTTQYPQHTTLWHDEVSILSGGGLVRASLADSPYNIPDMFYNVGAYQSSAANGDSFHQPFLLDAGDYNFYVLGAKNNVHGIVDWSIDGANFLTGQDWYHASVQANIIQSGTVTIATAGLHDLVGTMNGKNGSALAYALPLTKYWFEYVP